MDHAEISNLLQKLNLDAAKLQELASLAQANPFAAISKVQQLGISMTDIQRIMAAVMANPDTFISFAKQAGVSDEMIETAKGKLKGFQT